jgi:hypothetical protein
MPLTDSHQHHDVPAESTPQGSHAGEDEAPLPNQVHDSGFWQNLLLSRVNGDPAHEPRSGSHDDVRHAAGHRVQLYAVHFDETLTVDLQENGEAVIGRFDPMLGLRPALDLRPYNGLHFGVSRQHARLMLYSGTVHIMDMGSTNGTFVNGEQLSPFRARRLYDGDEIRLSQFKLMVTATRHTLWQRPDSPAFTAPGSE